MGGSEGGWAAERVWRSACDALLAPAADVAWDQLVAASPPASVWHSLQNCVSHQAGVWQNLVSKGMAEVIQPAAFKLALVLRHTPAELAARLLADLLHAHPQSQDLTSYVQALLTDDEPQWSGAGGGGASQESPPPPAGPGLPPHPPRAPLRDLQLYGDCELAILGASKEEYDAHAKLVRAEYSKLNNDHYIELRIKVLNQFTQIPKLFHTPEFECFEAAARENIQKEITTLREHLVSEKKE